MSLPDPLNLKVRLSFKPAKACTRRNLTVQTHIFKRLMSHWHLQALRQNIFTIKLMRGLAYQRTKKNRRDFATVSIFG